MNLCQTDTVPLRGADKNDRRRIENLTVGILKERKERNSINY